MPKDKDFKRLVRTRMARTGERYTEARAELRPQDGQPDDEATRREWPVPLIPLELHELRTRRAARVDHETQTESMVFGPLWDLTVEAGGAVPAVTPAAVSSESVAALGRRLGGPSYVAFGVDLLVPAPPGTQPDARKPPSAETATTAHQAIRRAHSQFLEALANRFGVGIDEVDEMHRREGHVLGSARRHGDDVVLPARSRTELFAADTVESPFPFDELDPFAWGADGEALGGTPWAGFGVVVGIETTFPTREMPLAPSPRLGRRLPQVPQSFWDSVGEALLATTDAVGLPDWPLLAASVRSRSGGGRVVRNWQRPDGYEDDVGAP
jgi:hypothetical protein